MKRGENMDFNMVLQAVSTVGFPIVCCGALFWYVNKQGEQHKEEMEKMTEALENNTIAITELSLHMKGEK